MIVALVFVRSDFTDFSKRGRYRKPFEGLIVVQLILLASRTGPHRFAQTQTGTPVTQTTAQVSV